MSDTKLVLCLMARNEASIIERCLRAALPLVDAYALSVNDTTDGTIEIAGRIASELGVPGTVIESPWCNFGSNRSKSVADTKAWVVAQGWDPARTYAILIDADHVLHARDAFRRELLVGPHYEIDTNDGRLRNPGTRVVRLSHDWKCIGVTHEYWASEPNTPATFFEDLWVEDLCDGGSKDDKLTRDVALLVQGLKNEPGNGRYMFYLAESYFHLRQWDNAITWYGMRINAGGWEEETWYARYKRGVALLENGETETGAGVLLQAFEARPTRAEPLAALAKHYRERGKNQLAYMLATRGAEVPETADRLFVELDAHHRCIEEISITGFYCGDKARTAGFEACDQLISEHGHPDHQYHHWACNESFYLQPLPCERRGAFPLPEHLRMNEGLPYYGTNPTIIAGAGATTGEQIVHVRLVNFEHTGGRNYRAFDPRNIFRTRGAVMRWEAVRGEVLSEAVEVTQIMPPDWPTDVQITGLEDQRWVWHKDRVWFTATCCQVPGAGGQPLVVFGLMNEALDAVERVMRLDYEHCRNIEKNWVPWSLNGEMLLIYSYEPFVVLKVDTDTGHCTETQRWMPPQRFARWRGSSSPVACAGPVWILLIHEVAYRATDNIYAHRWVAIDSNKMEIMAFSKPFVFDHVGVEYCGGLYRSRERGTLIATYGAEDKEPRWAEYQLSTVWGSLNWSGA